MSISNLTVLHKIDRDVGMSTDFLPDGILTIHNANYLRYQNAINILFITYSFNYFYFIARQFQIMAMLYHRLTKLQILQIQTSCFFCLSCYLIT